MNECFCLQIKLLTHRLKFMDGWPLRGRKSVHKQALSQEQGGSNLVKGIFQSGNACNQNNNHGIYGLEQILFDLTIFFVCCLSALLTPPIPRPQLVDFSSRHTPSMLSTSLFHKILYFLQFYFHEHKTSGAVRNVL